MINLYNDITKEDLLNIKKKTSFIIFGVSSLIVLDIVLMVILATYYTKSTFILVGSIIMIPLAILFTFFCEKIKHLKSILFDFEYIVSNKGEKIEGVVEEISKDFVTLPDKMRVREVCVRFKDDTAKKYYLSEIFDLSFMTNKKHAFMVVADYIKEYKEL